jgi:hypothetical protein
MDAVRLICKLRPELTNCVGFNLNSTCLKFWNRPKVPGRQVKVFDAKLSINFKNFATLSFTHGYS